MFLILPEKINTWPQNNKPTLYPHNGAEEGMGICPNILHLFCGSGKDLHPCFARCHGPLLRAIQFLYCQNQSFFCNAHSITDSFLGKTGFSHSFPLSRFCLYRQGQNFRVQSSCRRRQRLHHSGSTAHRWCGPIGSIEHWPLACSGNICSQVWSTRDVDQHVKSEAMDLIWKRGGLLSPGQEEKPSQLI